MRKYYHFIGIGGIGMSGLARILLQKNIRVSGSDLKKNSVTDVLEKEGAQIFEGHKASHVLPGATIVYSTQVKEDNEEIRAAKKLNCPFLHRSELLAEIMQGSQALAVAGTHGKTTTTSLLTAVLSEAGWNPSYAVGGVVNQLGHNASWGNGSFFVFEADESDGSFLRYFPKGAIVTNVDDDHLDHYGTLEKLISAFNKFVQGVSDKELLFWCGDDPILTKLNIPGVSYGFDSHCHICIKKVKQERWISSFDLEWNGRSYLNIEVALTGKHNVLNAAAVFGLSLRLGVPENVIRRALREFQGVGRRCEKKGFVNDVLVIDDYGHHPTEIQATLKALRRAEPSRRLIAVFQPHRYTRTAQCLEAFGTAFEEADLVIVTDIYAAMEAPIPGISVRLVIEQIQKRSKTSCLYVSRDKLIETIAGFLKPGDLVVTLGAGDITKVGSELIKRIAHQVPLNDSATIC